MKSPLIVSTYKKDEDGNLYLSGNLSIQTFINLIVATMQELPAPAHLGDASATAKDAIESLFLNKFDFNNIDDEFAWKDHKVLFTVDNTCQSSFEIIAINKSTNQASTLAVFDVGKRNFAWKMCEILSDLYVDGLGVTVIA